MGAHPLSFSEVLEDEYRYFHGEIAYQEVTIEAKHVREITDLDKRLAFHRDNSGKPSRWKVLADAVPTGDDRTAAVVGGLRQLLKQESLLEELLADDDFREEVLETSVRRALLRIPIARRLLLQNDKVGVAVASDPDLVERFAARSAAVRVLNAYAPQIFVLEPALLALIADDPVLDREIARDPYTAAGHLLRLFPASPAKTFAELAREYTPGFGSWRQKPEAVLAETERIAASRQQTRLEKLNAATLRSELRIVARAEDPQPPDRVPPAELSRFNMILIETAYADYVCDGQEMRAVYKAIYEQGHAALCLSGGGIRSATFNLGVLQGMADHRMLNRFHYISTVSGGGYIGSWLSSWVRRHTEGTVGVAKDLSRAPTDPLQPEVEPIRHLREYSSYLAPRATAFSLDSWTLVATYLRNLLLNWTMLIPALAVALAVPRLLLAFLVSSLVLDMTEWAVWGSLFAATFGVIIIGVVRPASELPANDRERARRQRALRYWLSTLVASAFLFCTYWANPENLLNKEWWILPLVFAGGNILGALTFGIRYAFRSADDTKDALKRAAVEVVAAAAAGLFTGWLLMYSFSRLFPPETLDQGFNLEIYICLSMPLYLLVFFAQSTLLVGLTTQLSRDYDREWWARSAAAVFVVCVLYATGSFAVLLLPVLIYESPYLAMPIGGLSGIGAWLLSRKWKSGVAGNKDAAPRLMPLLRLAATVVLLFIVAGIAMVSSNTAGWINDWVADKAQPFVSTTPWTKWAIPKMEPWSIVTPEGLHAMSENYVDVLRETRLLTLALLVFAAAAVAWIMALVLNVNIYSMHGMYRNRLIRAYLGASRWTRTPDPFTGFDPQDNIEMWNLRPHCLWQTSFINFEQFASDLAGKEWWKTPNLHRRRDRAVLLDVGWAREIVEEFNNASAADRKELKGEAMAAVVDTLNDLMRCCDLANNVPAPQTVQLLENNRRYLEAAFAKSLKKHEHEAPRLDKDVRPLEYPGPKDASDPLCKEAADDLLKVPPLHVVNASLNLVGGEKLAWQERKAASFTVTPLHSGSRTLEAYRDTAEYGEKITLGTAMAISGAAVSPNMGALSSPAFTFLMTLFNARLGWWIGNPARRTHDEASPRMSLRSLLLEALGRTDATHDYVFLSDGGHFENLGLYEIVLRRCKYIIVCDASADGSYGFSDLANAVRKIRIDLGIPIEPLVTKYIGPQKDERYGRYCAFGKIHYRNVDGGDAIGYLVYVKPAIYSDCPADVRNYANESKAFPHETTADQFFSESQFESYRALGRHVIGRICGDTIENQACVAPNVETFFAHARSYVDTIEEPVGDRTISNVSDVVSWMQASLKNGKTQIPVKAADARKPPETEAEKAHDRETIQ